jgi:predicted alpha/beta superfamily hydrolase
MICNPGRAGDLLRPMSDEHTLTGDIRRHVDFPSVALGNRRDVLVYLPPGYRRSRLRYPVFYMHDGQNLFDRATTYGGVEWGVDETAERLIRAGEMQPIIIVGIANAGAARIDEYAPTAGKYEVGGGGKQRSLGLARKYGQFLARELKPFIDSHYRTKPESEFTGTGGSSMGGLVSIFLGLSFPKVFSRLAVMSPSIWWDDAVLFKFIDGLKRALPLKIWLDTGTDEPGWNRARVLRDCLLEKGWRMGETFRYLEVPGAKHTESAWAARIDQVLKYLFPT